MTQTNADLTLTAPQTSADYEAAARVLAVSFQSAANFVAAFPDATARARALPHVFRMLVRDAAAFAGVTVARQRGDIIGAAVWYPPGQARLSLRRPLRALPELSKAFFVSPASFIRFARLGGELGKRHPGEPHAYLAALGVRPGFSGQGVGSALIRAGTGQADTTRQRCYLETFSEPNVRFYQRHGFEVTRSGDVPIPGGPPFWFMTRTPGQT